MQKRRLTGLLSHLQEASPSTKFETRFSVYAVTMELSHGERCCECAQLVEARRRAYAGTAWSQQIMQCQRCYGRDRQPIAWQFAEHKLWKVGCR